MLNYGFISKSKLEKRKTALRFCLFLVLFCFLLPVFPLLLFLKCPTSSWYLPMKAH